VLSPISLRSTFPRWSISGKFHISCLQCTGDTDRRRSSRKFTKKCWERHLKARKTYIMTASFDNVSYKSDRSPTQQMAETHNSSTFQSLVRKACAKEGRLACCYISVKLIKRTLNLRFFELTISPTFEKEISWSKYYLFPQGCREYFLKFYKCSVLAERGKIISSVSRFIIFLEFHWI